MSSRSSSPTLSDYKGDDIDLSAAMQKRRLDGLFRRIITPDPYIRWKTWQSQRAALEKELVELGVTQNASSPAQRQQMVQLKQQDLRRVELQIRELEKAIKEFEFLQAQAQSA